MLLKVTEGRAYCRATRQYIPCILPERQGKATTTLKRYLTRRYGREARIHLAIRTGLSESTIRNIQRAGSESAPAMQLSTPLPTPNRVTAIGVDDIYMQKGRFLVAVDLDSKKLLKLSQFGTTLQGRASALNLESFFANLPDARIVALDMNPEQYDAAKKRWPTARLVIDKRHLLQTIDRDLMELAARVVVGWWEEFGDSVGGQQAVRVFGTAAYPYLALRALVLRRRRSLTPADHAAWVLLRRERPREGAIDMTQMMWEAWLWREDLYDLFNVNLGKTQAAEGLDRWRRRVTAWQTQWKQDEAIKPPLRRILWALNKYNQATQAYADTDGITNARTELCNAALRHYLRHGRKYDAQALVTLVNRQPAERLRKANREGKKVTLGGVKWVRAPVEIPLPLIPTTPPPTAPEPEVGVPEGAPPVTVTAVPRTKGQSTSSRLLPKQAKALEVPAHVWKWLHQLVPGGRGTGERWTRRVVAMAPPEMVGSWQHYCAGEAEMDHGEPFPAFHLTRWRAVVCQQYVAHHPDWLVPRERERQGSLTHLNLDRLYVVDPGMHSIAAEAYGQMAEKMFWPPKGDHLAILDLIEEWEGTENE